MTAIARTFTNTAVLDLDALRRMTYDELNTLYRGARCPGVISELNGDTRGAMLAWRFPRTGPIAGGCARLAHRPRFRGRKIFSGRAGRRPWHQPSELLRQATLVSF